MNEESQDLYRLTGFALTRWGIVESNLCLVFCNCINPYQANPADKAFWSMMAFDSKLSATGNVLEDQFPKFPDGSNDQILASWSNLNTRLKKHNRSRNKLAHGSVVNLSWNSSEGQKGDTYLAPFHHSRSIRPLSRQEAIELDGDARPEERFYANDIRQITKQFVEDARKLMLLADAVRGSLVRSGFLAGRP